MRKIINLSNKPYFLSSAAVGGYEERRGPLGESFDLCDDSDLFGMESWEAAESEMGRISLNIALKKAALAESSLDVLLAGDLENQCVASSGGLYTFGIPYVGLYSACSTCTEALLLLSVLLSSGELSLGATVTTSHNSAAERQFRTPVEYGAQRAPSAQWTATAAGSFILSKNKTAGKNVFVNNVMLGKIVDGLTKDGANMGAAMARAAFDSVYTYLSLAGKPLSDYDRIITGDLGAVGSDILCELFTKEIPGAEHIHTDCGKLLYSFEKKNLHSGASGCGCSASVLAAHFLPMLESGRLKNILFLSTGALMNPQSVLQGNSILGIAPVINICSDAE
ncbi:MAG: stage V sporulation protein AD [Clostridia bacterium]|nr:stage V sporulation protein AD [Clostridia bacterium]